MMFEKSSVRVIEKWHVGQVSWVFENSSNKFKMQNPKGVPKSMPFLSSLLFFYVGGDDPGVRGAEEENRNKYTTI